MARLVYDNALGTLGSPLSLSGTTITFQSAPAFRTLVAPDYIPLTLDPPSGSTPSVSYERVFLTAYTAGSTTGTILRAMEFTGAAAHGSGAAWACAPATMDVAVPQDYLCQYATNNLGLFATAPHTSLSAGASTPTPGRLWTSAITLPSNLRIGNLGFLSNSGSTSVSGVWLALFDGTRQLLATTAAYSGAWPAFGPSVIPIANVASGAASVFTTTYSGIHWLGMYGVTISLANAPAVVSGDDWGLCGYDSGSYSSTPPTFPFTLGGLNSSGNLYYGFVGT